MPTLRQFEYLVAVADSQNFGRAAIACHVSQPTLSQQLPRRPIASSWCHWDSAAHVGFVMNKCETQCSAQGIVVDKRFGPNESSGCAGIIVQSSAARATPRDANPVFWKWAPVPSHKFVVINGESYRRLPSQQIAPVASLSQR